MYTSAAITLVKLDCACEIMSVKASNKYNNISQFYNRILYTDHDNMLHEVIRSSSSFSLLLVLICHNGMYLSCIHAHISCM